MSSGDPMFSRGGGISSGDPMFSRGGGVSSGDPMFSRGGGISSGDPTFSRGSGARVPETSRRGGTMTAPPKATPQTGRTRTQAPARESGKPAGQPERQRSVAAERAYARRAQRGQRTGDERPVVRPERKPGSASRASFVILVMVLLTGGVVATLWFSTQATADAYKLEQAKNTTDQLSVRVGQLRQQVAQQGSPQSLAQRAQQLGMIPAPDVAHLVVGPDGRVTVIGTPTKAVPPPPPVPSTTNAPAGSSTAPAGTTAPAKTTPPTGG